MCQTTTSKISAGFDILKSIYQIRFSGKRIPLYCEWGITSHCNMSCTFCSTYTNDRNAAQTVSREKAFQMLDQLEDMGTKIIHFSGGEPTLWKDLPELAERAVQKNMIVSMTTNGSSSIEKMERFLHIDLIRVSLDGPEEFHDSVRMTPGAYKRAIETLRFLRSKGKKPIIASILLENSPLERLVSLAQIAKDLGVQISFNIHGNRGDGERGNSSGSGGKSDYLKHNGSYSEYISVINKLRARFGNVITNPEPYMSVIKSGGLDVYGCKAMDVAIVINFDGSISLPCHRWPRMTVGGDLREIYFSEEAEEMVKLQGKDPACEGCGARCIISATSLLRLDGLTSIVGGYARNIL